MAPSTHQDITVEIPEYADEVMRVYEFAALVRHNVLTPDDGTGYYATGDNRMYPNQPVDFSKLSYDHTHVVWFSK